MVGNVGNRDKFSYALTCLLSAALAATTLTFIPISDANAVEPIYFESILNCGGNGGWVIVEDDGNGGTHMEIICEQGPNLP